MESTLIDIKKAAELLRISPQHVRNLCRTDKIGCTRIGSSWVINENDLKQYYEKSSYKIADDQNVQSAQQISKKKKPIALSFFSGAMGLDLGIEKAGFDVLLCCEVDNASRKTILKNKPNVALIGDIEAFNAEQIREAAGLTADDEIDLVVGGPPCQAFSTAGRRKGLSDLRGNLFLTYIDRISKLRPKFAVIENVRGLLSAPDASDIKGGVLKSILQKLDDAGYTVSFNLYNTANFGTPQKRERVVMICSRNGQSLPYLVPTHSEKGEFGLPKWRTFKDAVEGLPKDGHHYLEFPEKRLQYYRMLKAGQYWKHLPIDFQKQALGRSYYSGGGKTGFLRRLSWNEPSPTLVTHPAMPATDLAHPTENRPLSIEEYKRIQEFPDNWQIEGTLIDQYRQVGNAVPVSLGYAIGKLLISYLKGENIKIYKDFSYSRYANTDHVKWSKVFSISKNSKTGIQSKSVKDYALMT